MNRDEWFARQFPAGKVTVAEVVRRTGWIHTAGGTGPYLSLKARIPAITRQQIDDLAYRKFEILELPCVRESTMLVPREDAAIALAAGRRAMRTRLKKLPIDAEEIDALGDRIIKTLGDGTRSADQLHNEIPPKLITDLGEAGKKLGFTSTLPIALRWLQAHGRVIRLGEDLRLDAKRYFYRRWPASMPLGEEPHDLDGALAERFLAWAAPATVDDFAFWAGIGKTSAMKALSGGQAILPVQTPAKGVMLLPFRDNYFLLHRGLGEFAKGVKLLDMSNKLAPVEKLQSLHHNAIVAGGELRGIWEYDAGEEKIVWRTFQKTRGVEEAVSRTGAFIREELGDHKFYAFDHGRTREIRVAFVEE
jgi:Winged helix DNA-binding domain